MNPRAASFNSQRPLHHALPCLPWSSCPLSLLLGLALFGIVLGGCARTPPTISDKEARLAADSLTWQEANEIVARAAAIEDRLGCRIGLAYRDAAGREAFSHRGDELFHAASTMKLPVMIELMRRVDVGDASLSETIVFRSSFRSMIDDSPFDVPPNRRLQPLLGTPVTLLKLCEEMIVISDNTSTNLLIERLGAPRITGSMRALGASRSVVLRGVEDTVAFNYGLSNKVTAIDLNALLAAIEEGRASAPATTAEMKRILLAQEYNSMIPGRLPEGTRVAHKTGSIDGVRNDTAIVYAPAGAFYITVLVDGLKDGDAGVAAIAELSRAIYDAHEARFAEKAVAALH